MRRLGSPTKEIDSVESHLRPRARCAILILNLAIDKQRRRHGDKATGIIWIVVKTFANWKASRWVTVAKQQCESVITTFMFRCGEDRKVWRQCTAVSKARSFFVRVR